MAGLAPSIEAVWRRCEAAALYGRTVTLKVKFADFRQITRARTLDAPVASRERLDTIAHELLRTVLPPRTGVRLLGLAISGFDQREEPSTLQLALAL